MEVGKADPTSQRMSPESSHREQRTFGNFDAVLGLVPQRSNGLSHKLVTPIHRQLCSNDLSDNVSCDIDILDTQVQNLLSSGDGRNKLLQDLSQSLTSRGVFGDAATLANLPLPPASIGDSRVECRHIRIITESLLLFLGLLGGWQILLQFDSVGHDVILVGVVKGAAWTGV